MLKSDGNLIGLALTTERAIGAYVTRGSAHKPVARISGLPLPADLQVKDSPKKSFATQTVVRQMAASFGIKPNRVAVSLPNSETVTQLIKLPLMPRHDMHAAVLGIAEQYAVFNNDEVAVDFATIGEPGCSEPNKQSVLLVAAEQSLVDSWIDGVTDYGSTTDAVEPAIISVLRAQYPEIKSPEPVASVVIERGSTYINIFHNGELRVSYTAGVGLSSWKAHERHEVSEPFMDSEKAETHSTDLPRTLITEVRKALRFFSTQYPPNHCNRIVLAVDAGYTEEIAQLLATELHISVEPFDLKKYWELDPASTNASDEFGLVKVLAAIGLAIRGDRRDFPLQVSLTPDLGVPEKSLRAPIFAVSAACFLVLAFSLVGYKMIGQSINEIEKQITRNEKLALMQRTDSATMAKLLKDQKKLDQSVALLINSSSAGNRVPWSRIIRQFSSVTPENLWLTNVESKDGMVQVEGYALSARDVANYVKTLGASPGFVNSSLKNIRKQTSPAGRSVVGFTLEAQPVSIPAPVIKEDSKS